MHPLRPQTPLSAAIEAASEFKRFLDVQPAGSLFNPCGKGDVLDTATYAHAAALLDQAIAQCLPGTASPNSVKILASTVIGTATHDSGNGPTQVCRFLTEIAVQVTNLILQLANQDDAAFKNGILLELRLSAECKFDLPFELVNEEMNALHVQTPSTMAKGAFCHDSIGVMEVR